MAKKDNTLALSASRVSTFQKCSWQYWARYHLKVPDDSNPGALMGTASHTIFECLLNPRHRKVYDAILTEPATIKNSPPVARYIERFIAKWPPLNDEAWQTDEVFNKIDAMIIVGLVTDFFCSKGTIIEPELAFDITNENPPYRLRGFIDKPAIYNDKFIRIIDYKSSSKQFEGDELVINVQAMAYSLAAKKLYPHLEPIVDFLFLQFPDKPLQRLRFNDKQLSGFELFLSSIHHRMVNFTAKDAKSHFAADDPMPKSGFKGPLICNNWAKQPGQRKKNGHIMFCCSYKWARDYYALCNESGDIIKTDTDGSKLHPNVDKGEFVIKKRYDGCPKFKQRRVLS